MTAPVLQVPASPAQQRLWSIEQDRPGTTQHTLFVEVVRRDALDPHAVSAALADVVHRHESLRTDFTVSSGRLQQSVREHLSIPVEYIDLTGDLEFGAQRYDELCRAGAGTEFDLSRAPLLRLQQVRRCSGPQEYDTLLLAVHHLVADAVSMAVIVGDLVDAIAARSCGDAPVWTSSPVQYADFTQWHRERLTSAAVEPDRQFWRQHLAELEDLDLTLGRLRPAVPGDRGGAVRIRLDESQTQALTRLGAQHRATLFMVVLSAYATALGDVFGARDVPIGMATSGRPIPEVAHTVGLFTERLVLRVDLGGRPTFRGLLERVRDEVLTVLEHDSLGYDGIVEAVAPPRRYGVAPLAQASINLHDSPVPERAAGGIATHSLGRARVDTVRHDLALTLVRAGGALEGTLEFRHDVVPEATARRVATRFDAVLEAARRDPDARVDALALLTADEQRDLHRQQDGGPAAGGERCFAQLVSDWVRQTPDAVAVDAPGQRLTYRALWAQAHQVADRLARHGVRAGTEEPVIVAVPRSAVLPVCLLGIHLAGAVYVPLDPSAPALFRATLVQILGARLALVAPGNAGDPAGFAPDVTTLAVDVTGPAPVAPPEAVPLVTPTQLAYVLFTSGTTGRPKGVMVEHRNLAAYLGALRRVLAPPPGASHLMVQPPTFDSSLTMLAGALSTGGVLRLVDQDTAVDPVALGHLLQDHPADYLKITPTHLSALRSGLDPEVLRPRRALILGGEAARRGDTDRLIAAGWRVIGHYGPTETTVGVLVHDLADLAAANPVDSVPLGRPLPGTGVYVLDDAGRPVPPGRRGQLWVAGALVTRGYRNDPAATADAFRPDPFATTPGTRMYRTGDVVRRLPDGTFEFCGRGDTQLKVRGRRIEAGAVERAVAAVPGVTGVAVLARQERLVAYVVLTSPGPAPESIREQVAGRQPEYLVPDVVVPLPALPRTVSGKLDLAALPDALPQIDDDAYVPARTRAELIMTQLWCAVLGIDRVSVTSRFFDLGGDSIRAVHLAAGATARGLRLSVKDIFDKQTLQAMAAAAADGPAPASGGLVTLVGPPVVQSAELTPGPGHTRLNRDTAEAFGTDAAAAELVHDAYASTPADLAYAAVRQALALTRTTTATGSTPPVLIIGPAATPAAAGPTFTAVVVEGVPAGAAADFADEAADPGNLVPAAKTAIAAASVATSWPRDEDGPDVVLRVLPLEAGASLINSGVALTPGRVVIAVTGAGVLVEAGPQARRETSGPAELGALVARCLDRIVTHCRDCGPVYSPVDFPDAGLDEASLNRLLQRIDPGPPAGPADAAPRSHP